MRRPRFAAVVLGCGFAAAGQTMSLQAVVDSISANLDKIKTYRAESRIVQWFG